MPFGRHPLKMVCLPISPLPRFKKYIFFNRLHGHLQAAATSTVCVLVPTFCIRTYTDCAGFFLRLIRPTDSARGRTYRIVVLMVSCPAMYCSAKASVYSPASVKNVWRRVCSPTSGSIVILSRRVPICDSKTQGSSFLSG